MPVAETKLNFETEYSFGLFDDILEIPNLKERKYISNSDIFFTVSDNLLPWVDLSIDEPLKLTRDETESEVIKLSLHSFRKNHTQGYQYMFANREIMQFDDTGEPKKLDDIRRMEIWLKRQEKDQPHTPLTIIAEHNGKKYMIGYLMIGGGPENGVATLEIAIHPALQNNKIFNSLKKIIELYALEIKRIGKGKNIAPNDEQNRKIKDNFCCFNPFEFDVDESKSNPNDKSKLYLQKLYFNINIKNTVALKIAEQFKAEPQLDRCQVDIQISENEQENAIIAKTKKAIEETKREDLQHAPKDAIFSEIHYPNGEVKAANFDKEMEHVKFCYQIEVGKNHTSKIEAEENQAKGQSL